MLSNIECVKINALELENVKRIRAVMLQPTANGLTVIGGNNGQGKTSVLDAISWALGGDRYKPSSPARDGSMIPPRIRITLSNGLIVERSGKNSTLKVTDPNGNRSGQQLLNSFVEELALNLPKFMEASSRDKAKTLLQIIGVGEELARLETKESQLYNQRRAIGQVADQKKKYAKEMPFYPDAPKEPVTALELIQRQQAILAQNGENQRKRQRVEQIRAEKDFAEREYLQAKERADALSRRLDQLTVDLETAETDAVDLHDQSTAQIEADLQQVEALNVKVRANLDREKAEADAEGFSSQYDELTEELEETRQAKQDLLNGAQLPLEGLGVADGELTYHGKKWDSMSSSEQLRVSAAIVRALNPRCGFVLMDKLEQMDVETMRSFGQWLEEQGLQAITTRVSTGGECSVIIEDGEVMQEEVLKPVVTNPWKAGVF